MPAEGQAHHEREPFSGGEKGFVVRAVILANGDVPAGTFERYAIENDDWLIAADGGGGLCLRLGRFPDVVIGDLDSLSSEEEDQLCAHGAHFVRHPARKDFTDLELALRFAVEGGASEILIFGALGARWDQSLANILLPGLSEWEGLRIWLLHGEQRVTVLGGGGGLRIQGRRGDVVSLLPVGGDALGVTTRGLEYALNDETLYFGATRGVSNRMIGREASVSLRAGHLICVIIHEPTSDR
jgi:thiamine pyrophosphokinase